MADKIAAVHGVIRFLWHKIKEEGILDEANYGGLIPIIPHKEVPALMQAMDAQPGIKHFPYIVYSWTTNGYDQDWFSPCDQAVFMINSHDGSRLRELILLISNLLKRFDESGQLLDYYISTGKCNRNCESPDTIPEDYKKYGYQYTEVLAARSGGPIQGEDQPDEGMITLKIEYTHDRDSLPLNPPLEEESP